MQTNRFSIETYIPKRNILDIRTLLIINIVSSIIIFSLGDFLTIVALSFSVICMTLFKMWKPLFAYFATFISLFFISKICVFFNTSVLKNVFSILGFIFFMTAKIIPLIMIGHIIIKKIDSSVLVCALRRIGVSKRLVLAITVALRFLPTARKEVKLIRECMKMRGIDFSIKSFFKNPLKLIEYSIVPLLFRSVKTSEEMTAAAIVKGVECPCKKTSLIDVRISNFDIVFLIAYFTTIILVCNYGSQIIGSL